MLRAPSLAERPEDVALLAGAFLRRVSSTTLLVDTLHWLSSRIWPGNVRDLRAMVGTAAALTGPGAVSIDAALLRFVSGDAGESLPPSPSPSVSVSLSEAIAQIEHRMLSDALAAFGGDQSEAARTLGLSIVSVNVVEFTV